MQVPEEVITDLRAGGYIRSVTPSSARGVDVGDLVLVVYNTAASTVTLFQTPGVVRALAQSLVNWFHRKTPLPAKFELTAHGPNGYVDFRSDQAPDVGGLIQFLQENVWGDTAPSEIRAGEDQGNDLRQPLEVIPVRVQQSRPTAYPVHLALACQSCPGSQSQRILHNCLADLTAAWRLPHREAPGRRDC